MMTALSFLDSLQAWIVKNHPAIWAEWLVVGSHDMDFDDWVAGEYYDIYCAHEEYLGQASE